MKYLSTLGFTTVWLLARLALGAGPELVSTTIHKTYIPVGFDDNDKTQIVVAGVLPSTCHKIGPTEVKVQADGTLAISQFAYEYSGKACIQVFIPYTQVVDLGVLKPGSHLLKDAESSLELGKLKIKEATTSLPDDFIYAPVSEAVIGTDEPGNYFIRLSGAFPSKCFQWVRADVYYHPGVIVIQPIADLVRPLADCSGPPIPFSKDIPLRSVSGRVLIHVRSMEGQAINKMVQMLSPVERRN